MGARRELYEELAPSLAGDGLVSVGVFESHFSREEYIQVFVTEGIDRSTLRLQEGRSIVELSLADTLKHPLVTDFTKETLLRSLVTND